MNINNKDIKNVKLGGPLGFSTRGSKRCKVILLFLE